MRLLAGLFCLVLATASPFAALAAPVYPRYLQRQLDRGLLTVEEAELLLEGGLGRRPQPVVPTWTGYTPYFGNAVSGIDPLSAALTESERNNRLNEERYYADINTRENRYYQRNQPVAIPFGGYYGRPRVYYPGFRGR